MKRQSRGRLIILAPRAATTAHTLWYLQDVETYIETYNSIEFKKTKIIKIVGTTIFWAWISHVLGCNPPETIQKRINIGGGLDDFYGLKMDEQSLIELAKTGSSDIIFFWQAAVSTLW
jgi:hypothetical protein